MALKIIEFNEKYPHYNIGAFAYNPPTDTELLMNSKMSSLVFEPKRKHIYQEFCLDNSVFLSLLSIFTEEEKIYSFEATVSDQFVQFRGIRRGSSIYAVCISTNERVLFTHFPQEEEDWSDLRGLEEYDLC